MSVNDDLCEELDKAIAKAKRLVAEKAELVAALDWAIDNIYPANLSDLGRVAFHKATAVLAKVKETK